MRRPLLLFLLLAGCSSSSPGPSRAVISTPVCGATRLDEGIARYLAGDPIGAYEAFASAERHDPRDRAASVLGEAMSPAMEAARAANRRAVTSSQRIRLTPLPALAVREQTIAETGPKPTFGAASAWEWHSSGARADLLPPPPEPALAGYDFSRFFEYRDHAVTTFDGWLAVTAPGKEPLVFEVPPPAGTRTPPFVRFAQLVGRTLLVEVMPLDPRRPGRGRVAAFDATTGALAWSADMISGTGALHVSGGTVVVTSNADSLVALDLATGQIEGSVDVEAAPYLLVPERDGFALRGPKLDGFVEAHGLAAPPPAVLRDLWRAPPAPEVACWLRAATTAIDARDVGAIDRAAAALEPFVPGVAPSLRAEAKRLVSPPGIDLRAAPIVVAPPPGSSPSPSAGAPAARLVRLPAHHAQASRGELLWDPRERITATERGLVRRVGTPDWILPEYGRRELCAILPDERGGRRVLVYGGRYVAIVDEVAKNAARVLDLEAYRHPSATTFESVSHAQLRDDVLYVCNDGESGILSALDATTGELRWQSPPRTCNLPFVVDDAVLVAAYAPRRKPGVVHLVGRADGRVAQAVPFREAPTGVAQDGPRFAVSFDGGLEQIDLELR